MSEVEEKLKALEELEAKATGPKWHRFPDTEDERICHVDPHNEGQCDECLILCGEKAVADGDLAAALRNSAKSMVELIRALRAESEAMRHKLMSDTMRMDDPIVLAVRATDQAARAFCGEGG